MPLITSVIYLKPNNLVFLGVGLEQYLDQRFQSSDAILYFLLS